MQWISLCRLFQAARIPARSGRAAFRGDVAKPERWHLSQGMACGWPFAPWATPGALWQSVGLLPWQPATAKSTKAAIRVFMRQILYPHQLCRKPA